nr:hypothetical protein [Tanacetum cinerariifolium]
MKLVIKLKAKLEVIEALLRQDVKTVKHDMAEVVSKVVLYITLEMVYNDDLGRLIRKLMSSAIFYGRWAALEKVAVMKEPFDLAKLKVKLEVIEALLRQDVKTVKHDMAEVVSKVVLYIALEMVYSDELGRLIRKLMSSAIFYGRWAALEKVAVMKEP